MPNNKKFIICIILVILWPKKCKGMFKNKAKIENFMVPDYYEKKPVEGMENAEQYIMKSGSVWEWNKKTGKDGLLGYKDRNKNIFAFNDGEGKFERIEGEEKPPEPVIIQESLFAGQKPTPGASRFAKQPSQSTSSSIYDNGKFKMPAGVKIPTISMYQAPVTAEQIPVDVPGAVQYKKTSGSVWEINSRLGQLGHVDRNKNMDVFDTNAGKMKRIDGNINKEVMQPTISIFPRDNARSLTKSKSASMFAGNNGSIFNEENKGKNKITESRFGGKPMSVSLFAKDGQKPLPTSSTQYLVVGQGEERKVVKSKTKGDNALIPDEFLGQKADEKFGFAGGNVLVKGKTYQLGNGENVFIAEGRTGNGPGAKPGDRTQFVIKQIEKEKDNV